MKTQTLSFWAATALALALPLSAAAQAPAAMPAAPGGFVEPPAQAAAGANTVANAKSMRDDSPVRLQGHIIRSLGGEKYIFRDSTGEIVVEIDHDDWRGVTVTPDDKVEISGEIDRDFMHSTEIEVDSVKKL
jgi:uncharacterized protein (TIGR00156 family)